MIDRREQQNDVHNTNKKNIEEDKKMIKNKEEEMVISLQTFQEEPWMRNELIYEYFTTMLTCTLCDDDDDDEW